MAGLTMDGDRPRPLDARAASAQRPVSILSEREREVLTLLAQGLSGAQIAERLVLSPETVRTHVRNALVKLGASTRSQGVALALHRGEISAAAPAAVVETAKPQDATSVGVDAPSARGASRAEIAEALTAVLDDLTALLDVDGGTIFLTDEDGLALQRVATVAFGVGDQSTRLALGEGALGRVALDRRPQVASDATGSGGALIAAPMLDNGRLVGVIGLATRPSRPTGRRELLLLQALANRIAEVVTGGSRVGARLKRVQEGFRTSWTAATPPA